MSSPERRIGGERERGRFSKLGFEIWGNRERDFYGVIELGENIKGEEENCDRRCEWIVDTQADGREEHSGGGDGDFMARER